MQKIESYKVAWNANRDEGTILLNVKTGVIQIHLDSAMEGLLMLQTLRETSAVYVQNGVIFTGFEDVDEGHYERLRAIENEVVEQQPISYDLVSKVIPPKKERDSVKEQAPKTLFDQPKAVPSITQKATIPAKVKSKAKQKPKKKSSAKSVKDKLRLIEGIGPKIEELLMAKGIDTFQKLSKAKITKLKSILTNAGSRYAFHDPTTWPKQAALAANGKMTELKKWQDELKGGKKK